MLRSLLFIGLTILISCHKEESPKHHYQLVGRWKRTEIFVSPGNAGSWQPDLSNPPAVLEFRADGKILSNAGFYSNFTRYKLNADNTIEFYPPVSGVPNAVYYSFNSDTELTLTFACIEGCGERFVRY